MKLLQDIPASVKTVSLPVFVIRISLSLIVLLWIVGIIFPILFPAAGINGYLHYLFSFTCHQNHLKTINLEGNYMNVCSRCFGIYSGLLFSSLLAMINFHVRSFKLFITSCIILLIDVLSYNIGLYPYSKIIAFFTGFFLGWIGFFLILQGIEATIREIIKD